MAIIEGLSAIPLTTFRFIKCITLPGRMNGGFATPGRQPPSPGADSCPEAYSRPSADVEHTVVGPAGYCTWRESLVRPLALPWCPGYATVLLRCCSIGIP